MKVLSTLLIGAFSFTAFSNTLQKFNDGPNVDVTVIVSRDDNGKGNENWIDKNFVQSILNAASKRSKYANFNLKSIVQIKKSSIFKDKNQMSTLKMACSNANKNSLVVGISGENTTSTVGIAYISYNTMPCFGLRSRFKGNDMKTQKALDKTAYDFLHEIGHNMNLLHSNQVASGKLHTENYLDRSDGQSMAKTYIKKVAAAHRKFPAPAPVKPAPAPAPVKPAPAPAPVKPAPAPKPGPGKGGGNGNVKER